jgi:hypothetical protein
MIDGGIMLRLPVLRGSLGSFDEGKAEQVPCKAAKISQSISFIFL